MTIKFQKFDGDTMEIRSTDAITSRNSRGYVGEIVKDLAPTSILSLSDGRDRVFSYYVEMSDSDFNTTVTKEFVVNGHWAGNFRSHKTTNGYETARKALSAAKAWARENIAAIEAAEAAEATETAPEAAEAAETAPEAAEAAEAAPEAANLLENERKVIIEAWLQSGATEATEATEGAECPTSFYDHSIIDVIWANWRKAFEAADAAKAAEAAETDEEDSEEDSEWRRIQELKISGAGACAERHVKPMR